MIMASRVYRKRTRQKQVTCKKATSLIGAYVRANLSPEMNLLFEEHLRACPDCVSFLSTYKKTIELARSFLETYSPTQSLARIRSCIVGKREGTKATY
jgi:anti-sigma factor RsiW